MLTTGATTITAKSAVRFQYWMPFAILLCVALFVNFIVVPGHDRQRLVEFSLLLTAGTAIVLLKLARFDALCIGAVNKPVAVVFVLGVLSSISAYNVNVAACELSILFLLYMLSIAVATELSSHGLTGLKFILRSVGVAAALYTVIFAVTYLGSFSLHLPLNVSDFTFGFNNIRFFNHTQTSTLPLLLLLCCLTSRPSKFRWLWLAVTTYWWLALYATSARGTLVGMAAGCVVAVMVARKRAVPYLRQVALTSVLAIIAYYVLLVAIPPMFGIDGMNAFSDTINRTASDPVSSRTYLWQRAISLIVQHPWLGAGPMHFAHHAGDMHLGAHPHDWLMQIGAEWGLPALLCLLIAIGLGLRALVRTGLRVPPNDTDNQTIFAALLVGAVAILVDGLVSGIFVMPQSQLGVALYLGCALGWQRHLTPAVPQKVQHRAVRLLMKAAVVAAMVALITAVWADVPARWRDDDLTPAQQAANTGMLSPRLWKAGFF